MSVTEFENGYFYATDLRDFAKSLGISVTAKTRKDQLEKLIIAFLKSGKVANAPTKKVSMSEKTDLEKGLTLKLPIMNYISNKETKSFLEREALTIAPKMKQKSGARYWLNRWREDEMAKGRKITYGDLVQQFVKLNEGDERLPRIPSTRFNNFITDFLANEKNATRAQAMDAWEKLKTLEIPKNYEAWHRQKK